MISNNFHGVNAIVHIIGNSQVDTKNIYSLFLHSGFSLGAIYSPDQLIDGDNKLPHFFSNGCIYFIHATLMISEICIIIEKLRIANTTNYILVGLHSKADVLRALESGADDFIMIPYDDELLQTMIRNCIRLFKIRN